jgi:hypothetical protein
MMLNMGIDEDGFSGRFQVLTWLIQGVFTVSFHAFQVLGLRCLCARIGGLSHD